MRSLIRLPRMVRLAAAVAVAVVPAGSVRAGAALRAKPGSPRSADHASVPAVRFPRPPWRYPEFRIGTWLDYWLVCGAFPIYPDGKGPVGPAVREAAERAAFATDRLASAGGESGSGFSSARPVVEGATVYAWADGYAWGGKLDLNEHFRGANHGRTEYALAYGYAEIESSTAMTRVLTVFADDAVAVWWNGKNVLNEFVYRKYSEDPFFIPVQVRAGVNTVLVKIYNASAAWEFSVALSDLESQTSEAVWYSSTRFVASLITAGADPNGRPPWGVSYLAQAAHRGQAGMVRQLTAAGADPNRRSDSGRTPLDCAIDGGSTEAAEIIREVGGKESATPAGIEARIDEILLPARQSGWPGMAAAVVRQGEVIYRKAWGLADLEDGRPMTTRTRMQIGSVAKQFVAVTLLSLVESGRANLSDPIGRWLPDLPPFVRGATLRQLLSHQSGLPPELPENTDSYYTTWTAFLNGLAVLGHLATKPGEKFEYSSIGYVILAEAVERIAAAPLADVMRDRIFAPLGMHDTGLTDPVERHPLDAHAYTRSARGFERTYEDLGRKNLIRNAGAVWSTTEDLIIWVKAVEEHKILSPRLWADAMNPGKLMDGQNIPVGAGWFTGQHRSLRTSYHSGQGFGDGCMLLRFPDHRLWVIVQTNNLAQQSPLQRALDIGEACLWREMLIR